MRRRRTLREQHHVGLVAHVSRPVSVALSAIIEQQQRGMTSQEICSPTGTRKALVGDILTWFVIDSFPKVFDGISWSDFCKRLSRGERVPLRRYALAGPEAD